MALLEIACFNIESAREAAKFGVHRIEFCANRELGGTTPLTSEVLQLRNEIETDLRIMIRPRGGNFVYSDSEFQQMKNAIKELKSTGINGFVFGILTKENTVNSAQNKELIELAHPLPCAFHRAIDATPDIFKAMEEIIACGFSTILTSGGESNVNSGKETLKKMVQLANSRIEILLGGGLRSENLSYLRKFTGATSFHSSALTGNGEVADGEEIKRLLVELG